MTEPHSQPTPLGSAARRARVLAALLPASLLAGCGLATVTPPSVEVMSVRLVGIGLPEQQLAVLLCATNPNSQTLRLGRVTAALDVAGSALAAGESVLPVVLPARGSAVVPFEAAVTVAHLGPQLLSVLGSGTVSYRVHGTVSPAALLGLDVPYSRSGQLDLLAGGLQLASGPVSTGQPACDGAPPAA